MNLKKNGLQEVMGKQHASIQYLWCFVFLETGAQYPGWPGTRYVDQTKQAMKSKKLACFYLPSAVIKGFHLDIGPLITTKYDCGSDKSQACNLSP